MANGKKRFNLNKRMTSVLKGIAIYVLIALSALIFFYQISGGPSSLGNEVPISQIVSQIKEEKIQKISLEGSKITAEVKDSDQKLVSRKEEGESIYKILESSGVDPKTVTIEVKDLSIQQAWIGIISAVLPIILLVGLMFLLFRNAREGAQGIFSFAQSRARLYSKDQPQIKFSDVAGAEEAKRELSEIVEFLKTPEKFKALGAKIPKGVLMVGPAGTGKTLISRALAGEAGVPFYSIAGSEFMEMLVGVGASVTADTPVLIKTQEETKLIPIGEFVDQYYQKGQEGIIKRVAGIKTLGFNRKQNGFWGTKNNQQLVFDKSGWKDVQAVYRHQVKEIYEIEYLGGKLKATGDHSVFVRTHGRIIPKKVSELKSGDLLVELPRDDKYWPQSEHPFQFKRAIVKKITRKKYDGFVYDLCGVENEAFFGGEKPVLLHNSRVRDMFAQAKKASPSIIFVDEIESIGRQRGMGISGGHDEREQTLNQILVEMDGFTPNERVIVIAASVIGDTPILVKDKDSIKLLPIGEFVDRYYHGNENGIEKAVDSIETLGFDRKITSQNDNRLYFQNSAFKKIRSVFRHKVKEIYQITYLGGKVKTTGNHSVFVRTNQGIVPKQVSEIKKGDVLVNLPLKVNRTSKNYRELRSHKFNEDFKLTLPVYRNNDQDAMWEQKYIFAQTNYGNLSQAQIGTRIGVSQTTVGNWLRGVFLPREISRNYFNHNLPEQINVTPELCRLFGYYVAEGYSRKEVDFCFNDKEKHLVNDLKRLMKITFRLESDRERCITENAINIIYYSKPISDFFGRYGGKGARNKHVPPFLFEAPKEYFIEFLKGVLLGDGYVDKQGRGEITSISKQLILELNWLCRMHGIKSYIHSFTTKEGRVIKGGKPLTASVAYRLGFGKHNNPFINLIGGKDNPIKRPIVQKIEKLPFNDYVYDLCGVENEAFFGGESPILLHNTNRPDLLDAALVRPGRFDRRVVLNLPDLVERKAVIELHMKGKPFTKDVSIEKLARRTVGFSGADLANMLNEAAILAAREGKKAIEPKDLEEAATKEKLGPQRKRMQSERDRKLAAYHEAGHAIVGHFLKNVDPVHRISIVSRGMSGGHTLFPPTEDRSNESKSRLLDQITAALGGQAAEDLIFKDISTGAASDIEVATNIARAMVTQYGMSSLGPLSINPRPMFGMWGGEGAGEVSPKLHDAIDGEIKKIMDARYKDAQLLLKKNRTKLDAVAKALLKKETLESDEFESIVGVKKK